MSGAGQILEDDSSNETPYLPFLNPAASPSPFLWGPASNSGAAEAFSAFSIGSSRPNATSNTSSSIFSSQIPPEVMAPWTAPTESRHKFHLSPVTATKRSGTPELPALFTSLSVDPSPIPSGAISPSRPSTGPSPWGLQLPAASPFNPDSQEFVPMMNGSPYNLPASSQAGLSRAYPASPFPIENGAHSSKHSGSWTTVSLDASGSTLDSSNGSMRATAAALHAGLLSPPLDPKKKREHVSAPNSPHSPQPLADPTRSFPARGMMQRKDSGSAMKRRKLDFGEEEPASPNIWRQAAAGTYGAPVTPGGRAPSPQKLSPGKLEPLPLVDDRSSSTNTDQMDYVTSEYVDLGDVHVSGDSSPMNSSASSSSYYEGGAGADQFRSTGANGNNGNGSKARSKNPRNFMREFGSRSKNGYQAAKSFALGLNNGNSSSPERRSQPPSPTSHAQNALREMPANMRSTVCLELADLAKRESEFSQARMFFRAACQLDPLNAKAWLEYAKCEEENGHLTRAQRILADGFKYCCASPDSTSVDRVSKESIILRMLRLYSRTGDIQGVRQLIGTVLMQYLKSEADKGGANNGWSKTTAWPEELGEDVEGSGSNPPSPTRKTPSSSPVKPSFFNTYMTSTAASTSTASTSSAGAGAVVDDESASGVFPWRVIMEGANLEWKFGRRRLAHAVMDFLHRTIPTRAQPFMFAADLFKKEGRFEDAYRCIMRGIQNLPGAGMLYFEALQLMELIAVSHPQHQPRSRPSHSRNSSWGSREPFEMDIDDDNPNDYGDDGDEMLGIQDRFQGFTELEGGNVMLAALSAAAGSDYMDGIAGSTAAGSSTYHGTDPFSPTAKSFVWSLRDLLENILPSFSERALANLSPELIWKFHAEMASLYERASHAGLARKSLSLCERSIPESLLWKVWSHGARIELSFNNEKVARRLLMQAYQKVPKKMQSQVLLDWAHFEEILGNVDRARYILEKAIFDTQNDWKVMLELVLLELRSKRIDAAIAAAKSALAIHPSTGRLWSVLIQLEHLRNYDDPILAVPFAVFKEALHEVPKSGEVWCEGARLAIHAGRLDEARKFLDFSLHFTPQYGDSLIEYLRLDLLAAGEFGRSDPNSDLEIQTKLYRICAHAEPDYGPVWAYCKQSPLENGLETILFRNAKQILLSLPREQNLDISTHLAQLDFSNEPMSERRRILFG